jgi:hypothetical protein
MEFLSQLWMPIVVAAVLVFVVSSVIHMALPIHKSDKRPLPANEARVLELLRGTPAGQYMFPGCTSMKDMGTPEMMEKYKQGPVGMVTVMPSGVPQIGKFLLQWFLYSLLVGALTGYVAWHALGPTTTDYLRVFQLTGTVAWMAYGVGEITGSIWKGVPWYVTFKFVFDGLVYGLVTAGAFGWLWPRH